MKKSTLYFLLFLVSFSISAQEISQQKIKTEVVSAKVFLNSAQIYREKQIDLSKGEQIIRFVNLSPFIDKNSIQVSLPSVEILAINFEKNYLNSKTNSGEIYTLTKQLNSIHEKIDMKKVELSTIKEEIEFLRSNRSIGGNQTLTTAAIKNAAMFYRKQMKSYKTSELEIKNELKSLEENKNNIEKQITSVRSNKKFGSGEIILKIRSDKNKTVFAKLNYNVANVSWYPSYDLHTKDINTPLKIVYKANLKQNSQINWNNVNITFSSASPTNTNKVGEIIPYFLNYGTRPPYYGAAIHQVSGYVTDKNGPLVGVNITVDGTTIQTTTNFEGKYEIKLPDDAKNITFRYLGFQTKTVYANRKNINVRLVEDNNALDEVVVVGYGTKRNKTLNRPKNTITEEYEVAADIFLETKTKVNQTSFAIEVEKPYSIPSSNKDVVIPMQSIKTNANYTYLTTPKIEKTAFLTAKIKNWEPYNLLEGEANVYLEDTFIGTTLLDTRTANENLELSLGKDKNIIVDRIKSKKYTTKQFIGNKKEETVSFDIVVKNKKNSKVNLVVFDQIPISTNEEISISLDSSFSGKLDKKTGKVHWNVVLEPNQSKTLQLRFTVKSPKNRVLYID